MISDREKQLLSLLQYFLVVHNQPHPCNREGCDCGGEIIYEVYHAAGYAEKPTEIDKTQLRRELEADESLWFHDQLNNLVIEEASEEMAELYRNEMLNDPDFWETEIHE